MAPAPFGDVDPERFDAAVGVLALPFVFVMAISLSVGRFLGSIALGAIAGLCVFVVFAALRLCFFPIEPRR